VNIAFASFLVISITFTVKSVFHAIMDPECSHDFYALLDEALAETHPDELEPNMSQHPLVTMLNDGDWHVCYRHECPHAMVDSERNVLCGLTGIVFGFNPISEHDSAWTGRSTTNGDPDTIAGTPIGGWKPRRDALSESKKAFQLAKYLSAEKVQNSLSEKQRQQNNKHPSKRGALCVDESPRQVKYNRPHHRILDKTSKIEKLTVDACQVMDKLVKSRQSVANPTQNRLGEKTDTRLQNLEFVKSIAIRRYIDRVRKTGERWDLCRIHDVLVAANEFVCNQRKAEEERKMTVSKSKEQGKSGQVSGEMKRRTVALIVSLWKAVCLTPHLEGRNGTGDSFRPFVAGVLYGCKRGLFIDCLDVEIIPAIPELTRQLPTIRCTSVSEEAKNLQSSSHRGMCTLHRSIASIQDLDENSSQYTAASEAFISASRVCSQLRDYVDKHGIY